MRAGLWAASASAAGDDSLHDAGRVATERMYAEIHRNARRSTELVDQQPEDDAVSPPEGYVG